MDLQICIADITTNSIINLSEFVFDDKLIVGGTQVIYYSHGLALAMNYSNPNFDEKKMLAYLEELAIKISETNKCHFVDYYEQASMPSIIIKEYEKGVSKSISASEFEIRFDTKLNELINKLSKEYRHKTAKS